MRACNPDGSLRFYPGSPWLAHQTLRPQDRLRLFELHSSDSKILQDNFENQGRRVSVTTANGFDALKALLPPPPRRALVLIDPPYETHDDYPNVIAALQEGRPSGNVRRWTAGSAERQVPVPGKPHL